MNTHKLIQNNRLVRTPFFVIAVTTLAAIAISIYCLSLGEVIIFQNLFYVPIIIASMYYAKKGFVFSVALSFIYLLLIIAFTRDLAVIIQALVRVLMFGVIAGITAFLSIKRKRAEEEVARLNQQKELILCSVAEGILGLDLQGNHTFVNPAATRMLGYEVEELLNRPSHSTWHHTKPDGSPYPGEECPVLRAYQDGMVHKESTEVFWRKDGASFPIEYTSTPIYEQGRLAGAVVTFTDITERKQAEDALRESEKKYRIIAENTNDFIWILDLESTQVTYASPSVKKVTGYTVEEQLNRAFEDILTPQSLKLAMDVLSEGLKRNANRIGDEDITDRTEWQQYHKDGHTIWVEVETTFIRDDHGKPIGVMGVSRDISERKKVEEALRESEERYRIAIESSIDGFALSREGRFIYVNKAFEKMFGYKQSDEIIGSEIALTVHPEDRALVAERYRLRLQGLDAPQKYEFRGIKKDKSQINIEISSTKTNYRGQTVIFTYFRDITERKKAEAELKNRNKFIETILDNLPIGLAAHQISETNAVIYMNKKFEEIYGWTKEEIKDVDTFFEKIYPGQKEVKERVMADITSGDPSRMKWTGLKATGSNGDQKVISAMNIPLIDQDLMISTVQDITDRKLAEDAIRESEERHRVLFESSHDALMTLEPPSWNFTSCNPATVEMFRVRDEAEFISLGPWRLSPEKQSDGRESAEKATSMIETAMREGSHFFEWTHRRVAGETFPADVLLARMERGGQAFLQATVRDITDRKRMEEEILSLSITDQLTGLYNRRGFLSLAGQQLKLSERNKTGMLLFFADLDLLKWINDALGHEDGDKAIIEAANIFREVFRTSDIIARLGGDEFAILAIDIKGTNPEVFTARLQQLIDILKNQENRRYKLSISMGCSYYDPENPCSIDELMARADKLMYEQKQNKKGLLLQKASL